MDRAGRKVRNLSIVMRKGRNETRGFRMELLGIMFFGMAIIRMMGGLIRKSLEWTIECVPLVMSSSQLTSCTSID